MTTKSGHDEDLTLGAPLLRLIFVMVAGAMLAIINTTIVGIALPAIGTDLGASLTTTSWAGTGYIVAIAVAIGLSGWASMRFGLRRTWIVSVAVFIAGSALVALAPGVELLIAGRVVQGLGGGALEPLMLTAIARAAGPHRMGRAMAIVAAVIAIGPLVGPLGGGALVQVADWRWMFAAFVPLAGLVWVFSRRFHPNDDRGDARRFDALGVALLIGGVVLALLSVTRVGEVARADGTVVVLGALGVLLLGGYIWHASRIGDAAIAPLSPLRVPGVAVSVAIMAVLGAAIYPLFFGLPQFFQGVRGFDALGAGLLLAPHGVGALIGMSVGSRLSDTGAPRVLVLSGAVASGIGAVSYLALGSEAPLALYLVASFVTGLGTGFIGGPTVATLYRSLPAEQIPAGSTLLFILNQLGGAIGIATMTVLIASVDPVGWTAAVGVTPMLVPAVGSVLIVLLALRLPGSSPAGNRGAQPRH